jgi:hypothetical protein
MAQRQYFLGSTDDLDPTKITVQTLLSYIKFLSDIMENTDNEIKDKDDPPKDDNE